MNSHKVEWTEQKVRDFWHVNHANFARRRYSQQVGPALARLIDRNVPSGSVVLDYGCGKGDLLRVLDASRYRLLGTDYEVPEGFSRFDGDVGAAAGGQRYFVDEGQMESLRGKVDAILLIEVVEHLDDATLDGVLARVEALLRPDGSMLVTTPNREDLAYNTVNCPDCGCIFHRVQHVRSWTAAALTERLARNRFSPISIMETDLGRMQRSPVSRWIRTILDKHDHRIDPHLVGFFRK
jgi:SAM-dependent methyltransferase